MVLQIPGYLAFFLQILKDLADIILIPGAACCANESI